MGDNWRSGPVSVSLPFFLDELKSRNPPPGASITYALVSLVRSHHITPARTMLGIMHDHFLGIASRSAPRPVHY